jgi:nicotinate-nucleotide pyrophosphorylase (carboxylating)
MTGVELDAARVERTVRDALTEDVGVRDATSEATVDAKAKARAILLAKQDLVVAGLGVAETAFRLRDPHVQWTARCADGDRVADRAVMAELTGQARALLTAERVALNFLQRLSGVATVTRRFVEAMAGGRTRIRDTRKTTPLLRYLEKHAVAVGGATPHRQGLDSAILVKDNHVRLAGGVREATRRAMASANGLEVEVEVERLDQIEDVIAERAHMILLDNFTPEQVRAAMQLVAGRIPVEVSGGVKLDNVRAYAEAGPDYIAIGALTHSAPACDISLEIEPL